MTRDTLTTGSLVSPKFMPAVHSKDEKSHLALYPLDGMTLTCHDLRRTYARQQYVNGMDIVAIKDNLGHASIATTQTYIGTMDAKKHMPSQGYQYLQNRLFHSRRPPVCPGAQCALRRLSPECRAMPPSKTPALIKSNYCA